jgi:hypothetical protein
LEFFLQTHKKTKNKKKKKKLKIKKKRMSSSQKKEKSDSTDQVTTTNSELNSWYLYEAAAAAFTIVALTQLLPAFMNGMAANNEGDDHLVYIGIVGQRNRGFEYTWLLVPFVVVLQIFFLLLCGPLGDLNSLRKPLFILNLVLGAIGLMLFVVVDDSFFAFSGVLLVFVSVCSSLAMTFFNAFLVTIARDRADVKEAETKAEAEGQDSNTSAGVLVDRTIRMSVGGVISSFCGAIILTIIVTLITLASICRARTGAPTARQCARRPRRPAGPITSTPPSMSRCPSIWRGLASIRRASLSAEMACARPARSTTTFMARTARVGPTPPTSMIRFRRRSMRRSATISARCPAFQPAARLPRASSTTATHRCCRLSVPTMAILAARTFAARLATARATTIRRFATRAI